MSRTTRHELIDHCRQLEEIVGSDCDATNRSAQVVAIMKVLAQINVDPLLLRNAKIVMEVNDLRQKIADEEVIRLSKELLTTWKSEVVAEMNAIRDLLVSGVSGDGHSKHIHRRVKYINEYKRLLCLGVKEENRVKSREMIAKALMADKVINEDILKMARIAAQIETEIFNEFRKTGQKYKIRVRSRVANLSDECNVDLRRQVIKGVITAREMATMSAQDMANDRLKKLRERFTKESMAENILPEVYGTTSELLTCPECKQNTCTYNQVQIERADEPMTTFCLCITCGHRWRFN